MSESAGARAPSTPPPRRLQPPEPPEPPATRWNHDRVAFGPRLPRLIDEVACNAAQPAYTAQEQAPARSTAARGRRVAGMTFVLFVGLLTAAAGYRQAVGRDPDEVRAALTADVRRYTETNGRLATHAAQLRRSALAGGAEAPRTAQDPAAVNERLAELRRAAGYTRLQGPGVRVVLSDTPSRRPAGVSPPGGAGLRGYGTRSDDGRIRDNEVAEVVNILWAAGAESVAVNGVRVTATAAIRSAGEAILVNFQPLDSPYEIVAIGQAGALSVSLRSSAVWQQLEVRGATAGVGSTVAGETQVVVPAAAPGPPLLARGLRPTELEGAR